MSLNAVATYPNTRCYVLKLHRDAEPSSGRLIGRLEHITTGEHVDFHTSAELVAWLTQHAAQIDAQIDAQASRGDAS